jgi:AAA15 family ATPase/GTPase
LIRNIEIKNYKSIERLEISLGRFNIFVGENGAGKSNILEAIAFAGAASANKLDNEFLSSRGIRVTQPELMRAAFKKSALKQSIEIVVEANDNSKVEFAINNDNAAYSKWDASLRFYASKAGTDRMSTFFEQSEFAKLATDNEEFRIDAIKFANAIKQVAETIDANKRSKSSKRQRSTVGVHISKDRGFIEFINRLMMHGVGV